MKKLVQVFIILLAGCATTHVHDENLNESNSALVKGISPSFLKGALMPLGTSESIFIRDVDGKDLKKSWGRGYPTNIRVSPGKHKLKLYCSIVIDRNYIDIVKDSIDINIEVEAGHIYQFRSKRCDVVMDDITGKEGT